MEYVYAALMLHSAGKEINESAVKKVVEAAGAAPDEVRIKALVAALEGVDISKALSQAASMPVAAAAAAPTAAAAPAAAKAPAKEEAKEEKKDEAEESGIEGLGALFG